MKGSPWHTPSTRDSSSSVQGPVQKLPQAVRAREGQRLAEECSLEETNTSLHHFKNGKPPRADNLPKELHVALWDQVGLRLLEGYREHLQEDRLGVGLQRDLITLLYRRERGRT